MAGVEVCVEGLSKSFGKTNIWSDVTLTLPPGEVSVLLGPSGTGKSVFLKCLVGLLKSEEGSIFVHDTDLVRCSERRSGVETNPVPLNTHARCSLPRGSQSSVRGAQNVPRPGTGVPAPVPAPGPGPASSTSSTTNPPWPGSGGGQYQEPMTDMPGVPR